MSTRRKLAIGILFPIAFLSLTLDRGGRGRFCPKTLEFQRQSERTILWGIPIYRSDWEPTQTPQLIVDMVEAGFVTALPGPPDHWVILSHYNGNWKDGDGLLHRLFNRRSYAIREWSMDNPEMARVYWDETFRLLRSKDPAKHSAAAHFMILGHWSRNMDELEKTIQLVRTEVGSPD